MQTASLETPQTYGVRQLVGACLFDIPRFLWNMRRTRRPGSHPVWVNMRNRNEELTSSMQGSGVKCEWDWTSELHLANVFPVCGKWLCKRALRDFPIVLSESPLNYQVGKRAEVCFVIGHRGPDRFPLLLQTLRSIAGQTDCTVECVVVEQDDEQRIRDRLPEWVQYIHTPLPRSDLAYSRAWALNIGARVARSECLVFHDGDMLVPKDYAKGVLEYHRLGFEIINLKRFIFYLSKIQTEEFFRSGRLPSKLAPGKVLQNLESGGSMGVDREAFWSIGGFDERFVGWGGEDNELWERAQMRRVYPFGFLPMVHLWHAPQSDKHKQDEGGTLDLYRMLCRVPISERVRALRGRTLGEMSGPKMA